MGKINVVKRHQYADYLNVGTESAPDYVLMGAGFTAIDESPNAKSESVKYVNDVSASSSVVSYETQFSFEAEQIVDERAIAALYEVGRNHYTGSEAEFDYIRAELWNAVHDYKKTADTSISAGKTYFTRSGSAGAYIYTKVEEPKTADIATYYEDGAKNTYQARKFTVSAEVSKVSGENKMSLSGNLNAVGDPVLGTFNTETKTFTKGA